MNNLFQVDGNSVTIFCCQHYSRMLTILNNIVEPESSVTTLFNTVNSLEQCGQQNIIQYCFHQLYDNCYNQCHNLIVLIEFQYQIILITLL